MKKREYKKLQKIACSLYTLGETYKRNNFPKSKQTFLQYCSYLGYKIHQKAQNYHHNQEIDLCIIPRHQFAWQNRKINSDDIYGIFDKYFQKFKRLVKSSDYLPSVFKRLLAQTKLKLHKIFREYRNYQMLSKYKRVNNPRLRSA